MNFQKESSELQQLKVLVLHSRHLLSNVSHLLEHGFSSPLTQFSTISSKALIEKLGNEFFPLT
jgi:hypothetical protein